MSALTDVERLTSILESEYASDRHREAALGGQLREVRVTARDLDEIGKHAAEGGVSKIRSGGVLEIARTLSTIPS
jgi:hypothetical protein